MAPLMCDYCGLTTEVLHNGGSTSLGVGVLASHVVEEVVDVGEEVVVRVRDVRDEEVSSRAERSPKILSPFSRTGLKVVGFRRPIVPTYGARRKPRWRRS